MSEKLNQLKAILGEVSDLNRAQAVLGWDQQVNMPPAGGEARGLPGMPFSLACVELSGFEQIHHPRREPRGNPTVRPEPSRPCDRTSGPHRAEVVFR